MKALDRRLLWAATLLVGGTGFAYGVVRYLVTADDPFSVVNHPWQPHLQHLHVLAAPLLVFAVGRIWPSHVARHLWEERRHRRRSGLLMCGLFVPMVASGYALQVSVNEHGRLGWAWVHSITGALWLLGFVTHLFFAGRAKVYASR